jgi:hypothetical protein
VIREPGPRAGFRIERNAHTAGYVLCHARDQFEILYMELADMCNSQLELQRCRSPYLLS